MKGHNEELQHTCNLCNENFTRITDLNRHQKIIHAPSLKRKAEETQGSQPKRSKQDPQKSLSNIITNKILKPEESNAHDLISCFQELKTPIQNLLKEELRKKRGIKWCLIAKVHLTRTSIDGEIQTASPYLHSGYTIELIEDTIEGHFHKGLSKISSTLDAFCQEGSGWILDRIEHVQFISITYSPLSASSYIRLPEKIVKKKAVLNIINEDTKCFLWSILAAIHKVETHPDNVNHYQAYENSIKMGKVQFPVAVKDVGKIEKLNHLRINIFGCEDDVVFPLHLSKQPHEQDECINLLLIADEMNHHYCLITNLSRLISSNVTNHNGHAFICNRCLQRFQRQDLLNEHLTYCNNFGMQRVEMPSVHEKILKFKNINYQHPVPYIIFADFESIIDPENSTSSKTAQHIPCGYAYIVIGPEGKSIKPITVYRGENAASHFMKSMISELEALGEKLTAITPLKMTPDDLLAFESATHCHLCQKPLGQDKIKEHDHLTGSYRGAAHNACNMQYKMWKTIPVAFHNLRGYDGHHIIQCLGEFENFEFDIIAQTMEKYICFSMTPLNEYGKREKVRLRFIDTLQFLQAPLQTLVSNLSEDNFTILKENMPHDKIPLLLQKGTYPYEYMDSFEKFSESKLPPIEAFFSTLSKENISQEEYSHAQKVWKSFNIQTLGEYHDLYVKSDVLQLADVFQNFRLICMKNYGLDPAHLLTAPGLAWESCLKMTQQPLELFTDVDMHLFIESGIRGGVSMICKRYSAANNKYLSNYQMTSPSKYLIYLDANNLYGWAMSQPLPYGNFKWECVESIDEAWIHSISEDSTRGFVFEVDLDYPDELHDLHNDFPLASEKLTVKEEMLSPKAKEMLQKLNGKFHEYEKLVPNLMHKRNYICYHKNLQFYLSHGMKLKKIHKVLSFSQKPWLKKYIDFNTEERKKAASTFEKNFFKLMNNAVYGKTMENVRKHKNFTLATNEHTVKKLVAQPSFKRCHPFGENLAGIERLKKKILLNKPLYIGFVILELSKVLMYQFHYDHIKTKYENKAQLLFTDTDSLAYEIQTEDVYEDMSQDMEKYDTSDYPLQHKLYSTKNKKIIGKFKDETNSVPIQEFIGLRSKMYSILTKENEKKTAKGVSRHVIKHNLTHEEYRKSLFQTAARRDEMMRIGSESHKIYTIKTNKISLSPFDDKRYICNDGTTTLAYGHYAISMLEEM